MVPPPHSSSSSSSFSRGSHYNNMMSKTKKKKKTYLKSHHNNIVHNNPKNRIHPGGTIIGGAYRFTLLSNADGTFPALHPQSAGYAPVVEQPPKDHESDHHHHNHNDDDDDHERSAAPFSSSSSSVTSFVAPPHSVAASSSSPSRAVSKNTNTTNTNTNGGWKSQISKLKCITCTSGAVVAAMDHNSKNKNMGTGGTVRGTHHPSREKRNDNNHHTQSSHRNQNSSRNNYSKPNNRDAVAADDDDDGSALDRTYDATITTHSITVGTPRQGDEEAFVFTDTETTMDTNQSALVMMVTPEHPHPHPSIPSRLQSHRNHNKMVDFENDSRDDDDEDNDNDSEDDSSSRRRGIGAQDSSSYYLSRESSKSLEWLHVDSMSSMEPLAEELASPVASVNLPSLMTTAQGENVVRITADDDSVDHRVGIRPFVLPKEVLTPMLDQEYSFFHPVEKPRNIVSQLPIVVLSPSDGRDSGDDASTGVGTGTKEYNINNDDYYHRAQAILYKAAAAAAAAQISRSTSSGSGSPVSLPPSTVSRNHSIASLVLPTLEEGICIPTITRSESRFFIETKGDSKGKDLNHSLDNRDDGDLFVDVFKHEGNNTATAWPAMNFCTPTPRRVDRGEIEEERKEQGDNLMMSLQSHKLENHEDERVRIDPNVFVPTPPRTRVFESVKRSPSNGEAPVEQNKKAISPAFTFEGVTEYTTIEITRANLEEDQVPQTKATTSSVKHVLQKLEGLNVHRRYAKLPQETSLRSVSTLQNRTLVSAPTRPEDGKSSHVLEADEGTQRVANQVDSSTTILASKIENPINSSQLFASPYSPIQSPSSAHSTSTLSSTKNNQMLDSSPANNSGTTSSNSKMKLLISKFESSSSQSASRTDHKFLKMIPTPSPMTTVKAYSKPSWAKPLSPVTSVDNQAKESAVSPLSATSSLAIQEMSTRGTGDSDMTTTDVAARLLEQTHAIDEYQQVPPMSDPARQLLSTTPRSYEYAVRNFTSRPWATHHTESAIPSPRNSLQQQNLTKLRRPPNSSPPSEGSQQPKASWARDANTKTLDIQQRRSGGDPSMASIYHSSLSKATYNQRMLARTPSTTTERMHIEYGAKSMHTISTPFPHLSSWGPNYPIGNDQERPPYESLEGSLPDSFDKLREAPVEHENHGSEQRLGEYENMLRVKQLEARRNFEAANKPPWAKK